MAWTSRLPVHVGSLNRLAIESRVSECFALPPLPLRERSTRQARRVRASPSTECLERTLTPTLSRSEVGYTRLRLGEGADNLYFPERRLGCLVPTRGRPAP